MSEKKNKTGAESKPAPVSFQQPPEQPLKQPSELLFEELDRKASLAHQDHYIDPSTGYLVMTSFFLKNRGYCCDNGCRHCPYRGQNV